MKKYSFLLVIISSCVICSAMFAIIFQLTRNSQRANSVNSADFFGNGTKEDPYIISSKEDLFLLRKYIESGENFEGVYFLQNCNIDFEDTQFETMATGERSFDGVYDGGGHEIRNIIIEQESASLFENLGGVIANLSINGGRISGLYAAPFALYATDDDATIINCRSKIVLQGQQESGIAYEFEQGYIVCCISECGYAYTDYERTPQGILYNGTDVKVYACFMSEPGILFPSNISSSTSHEVDGASLSDLNFVKKFNCKIALAQYLFATRYGINLKQITLDATGSIVFSNDNILIRAVGLLNYWLLPMLLGLSIFNISIFNAARSERIIWKKNRTAIITLMHISLLICAFYDVALIFRAAYATNISSWIFAVEINSVFLTTLLIIIDNRIAYKREANDAQINDEKRADTWIIAIIILITVVCELLQFNNVPRFDGSLYYGSLIRSLDLFNMDLLSYIGAFVCWKWIHGLVLFIAPFEYFFKGQMIGLYIGNIIISVITDILLYKLVRGLYPKCSKWMALCVCLIFAFMPYQMGLFTYLCMDYHLAYFAIWLIYAVYKKNDYLICFCGYLLAFTKITGMIYYVFFLLVIGICEIIHTNSMKGKNIFAKFAEWFNLRKVILWVAPAILFMGAYIIGDFLTIQNFYGTYVSDSVIKMKTGNDLFNTINQTFVYALRWIFVALILIAALCAVIRILLKKEIVLMNRKTAILMGTVIAALGVFCILVMYNADAECPRYTAIMNATYALLIPWALLEILPQKKTVFLTNAVYTLLMMAMVVQTYWTIDPSLLKGNQIDTGKTVLRELTVEGNSNGLYYCDMEYMSDLYVYNYQHTFYDGLLNQIFSQINPDEDTVFYSLDAYEYELHASGSYHRNYKIYWNSRIKRRTYDGSDADSIYLTVSACSTSLMTDKSYALNFADDFWLLEPYRVDAKKAERYLTENGFSVEERVSAENIYGCLNAVHYVRNENE